MLLVAGCDGPEVFEFVEEALSLKDFRRIATRYDRLAENFLSALALVATICFWIS